MNSFQGLDFLSNNTRIRGVTLVQSFSGRFAKLWTFIKTKTSPCHPSRNGMVEVFNKTLLNMISAYVNDNQKDWDIYLPLLTSAYRSCAHDSSGLSPNQIMLGREVQQPISLAFGFPGSENCPASLVEFVTDLWNK